MERAAENVCGQNEQGVDGASAPAEERAYAQIPDLRSNGSAPENSELYEFELSQHLYYAGELDKAYELCETLCDSQNKAIALAARTAHMVAAVALGDARTAYDDLQIVREECEAGFKCSKSDPAMFRTSIISAMRVESVVGARIIDCPDLGGEIEELSTELKAYCGFLHALRAIREGEAATAIGIARAFQMIAGERNPIPCMLLHLVTASASMLVGDRENAYREYDSTWAIFQKTGIYMPFVEMGFMLFGMNRRYYKERRSLACRRIDGMVFVHHKGWAMLRELCGLDTRIVDLSPLEGAISVLVCLGWRNKEIAHHLRISENTVKHKLSEVYQQLHVKNRAEIQAVFSEQIITRKHA